MNDTTTTPRILADLHFLTDLVRQIGPERVRNVSTISGLIIHPVDREDGHAIGAELGLTEAVDYPSIHAGGTQHRGFTSYRGSIDGHDVGVHASPRYVVIDADTGEALTPPRTLMDANALAFITTGRNVHVVAVTR